MAHFPQDYMIMFTFYVQKWMFYAQICGKSGITMVVSLQTVPPSDLQ